MEKSPVTPCPDAETLAAWLDHGLDDHERAGVTAHVAACDDCRGIVANVLKLQDADAEPEEASSKKPKGLLDLPAASLAPEQPVMTGTHGKVPWSKITWGGGVLAAAAAVLLAVNLQPRLADRWRTDDAEARLAELAQATDGQRTVEGRLTGGFGYGPLRAPVRSAAGTAAPNDWALLAAAAKISEEAEKSPVAANLHGLGLAALVLGDHDEAISALEDATSEEPETGRYQSDLAAAYLARAQAADRPDDLTRGLTAAERALKADGDLLEARFNRALALERLYLTDQARKAWQEYLEHDPSSPWSEEARQHLQALPEGKTADDQARNNSPPEVGPNTVEAALDWILRVGLLEWADAVLVSDLPRAARQHSQLLAYARTITETSNDPFAVLSVRLLQPTRIRANGVKNLSLGLRALVSDDLESAERHFLVACKTVPAPLDSLCRIEAGHIAVLRRPGADIAAVGAAMSFAEKSDAAYLRGRAKRLEAWRLLLSGQTVPSMAPYLSAYEAFENGRYYVHAGLVASQVADLLDLQGLTTRAWQWRLTALRLAAVTSNNHLTYITRISASGTLQRRRAPEAALAFADSIGLPDPSRLPSLRRVSRERLRLGALLAAGNPGDGEGAIDTIESALIELDDFRAQLQRPELMLFRANLAVARGADDEAKLALDGALASMNALYVSQRISALLLRSRIRTRLSHGVEAEFDVREAIRLLVERSPTTSAQALQLYDAQAALDTVSDLVLARADLQNARGLLLLEQLREVLDGTATEDRIGSDDALEQRLRGVRPDQSLVYYLFSGEHRLLAWVISSGEVSFVTLEVGSSEVARLVNLLTVQVSRAPARERAWRATLANLHEVLIGSLPIRGRELIVIPDGVLNRVPFGSLIDRTNRFLFEEHTVRLAPNIAFASGRQGPREPIASSSALRSLVVGEPTLTGGGARAFDRLPGAKSEARAVARLYDSATLLVGSDATRGRVLDALPQADVLHFAGHAVMSADGAEGAHLLLSGTVDDASTLLRIGDASQTGPRVPARVVLAACGTAAASVDRSSGAASLAASFLRAGSQSVVGTLWPVEDHASEEFFVELHHRLTLGDSMATALARAQQACRVSPRCRESVTTWVGTAAYGSS